MLPKSEPQMCDTCTCCAQSCSMFGDCAFPDRKYRRRQSACASLSTAGLVYLCKLRTLRVGPGNILFVQCFTQNGMSWQHCKLAAVCPRTYLQSLEATAMYTPVCANGNTCVKSARLNDSNTQVPPAPVDIEHL